MELRAPQPVHDSQAPRIRAVTQPDPEVSETLGKTLLRPGQDPLNIFRTLAVHPALLKRFNIFTGLFISKGELPPRERELLILRVAARTACRYEWHQHVPIAVAAGVSEQEVAALETDGAEHLWSADDRTLLQVADDLLETDDVSDAVWARAREAWSDAQLVEMIMLVGCYRMVAGFLRSVRVELD